MEQEQGHGDDLDRALLDRVAAGDRAALSRLYLSYRGRLSRFLSRFTRRTDLIEEIINECFWVTWQKAGNFHGDSRVSTWITGIAYRCCLKAIRQLGDVRSIDDEGSDDISPSHDPNEDRQLSDWLRKGLERLSADQREVVELVYGVGHSLEEVAKIMCCPIGTIKARLFHARMKLRNVLPLIAAEKPLSEGVAA